MSASLLKKSLKLFEENPPKNHRAKAGAKNNSKTLNKSSNFKKQPTLKDKKVKSALETYVQKNPRKDKTEENLAVLAKISENKNLSQDSANKVCTCYYLLYCSKIIQFSVSLDSCVPLEEKQESRRKASRQENGSVCVY